MTQKIRYEAHRGVGTEFPENTLPAFEAAVRQGYDMIELDLKFTADNHCVVLHDRTVGRTARTPSGEPAENRKIVEMTIAEARTLDYGLWKGEPFRGTQIPHFTEVLALAKSTGVSLKIDNCYERFPPEQREILYREIEEANLTSPSKIGFTCANAASFAEVTERFPEAEFHYDGPVDENFADVLAQTKGHRTTVWIPCRNEATSWVSENIRRASKEYVEEIHKSGCEVGIWLLRSAEELRFAQDECGADIIETDGTLKPR